mgnify:CR=1 FL=1
MTSLRGRSRNTIEAYRRDLRRYQGWLEGHALTLLTVSHTELTEFVAERRASDAATSSIARQIAAIRMLHRYLATEQYRADDPTARGNEIGGAPLTFHSDGSDLVGLLCLDAGVSGGESLVANALFAHNELVRTEPELAAELYAPLPYDFRGEQRPGSTPYYLVPTFSRHRGSDRERLFIRYIRPFIEASQRHPDAPRLTDRQRAAMDAYDALITAPENRVEMLLQPGEMQFVNNYHVLHGRRGYADDVEAGRVRWLKRLWLATDVLGPDDRPSRYQRVGAMAHWGEQRTKA